MGGRGLPKMWTIFCCSMPLSTCILNEAICLVSRTMSKFTIKGFWSHWFSIANPNPNPIILPYPNPTPWTNFDSKLWHERVSTGLQSVTKLLLSLSNNGMLNPTPSTAKSSLVTNPPSAMTESPLSNKCRRSQHSVSSLSEIDITGTKMTAPVSDMPNYTFINTLRVSVPVRAYHAHDITNVQE